jgi:hypothetical protein
VRLASYVSATFGRVVRSDPRLISCHGKAGGAALSSGSFVSACVTAEGVHADTDGLAERDRLPDPAHVVVNVLRLRRATSGAGASTIYEFVADATKCRSGAAAHSVGVSFGRVVRARCSVRRPRESASRLTTIATVAATERRYHGGASWWRGNREWPAGSSVRRGALSQTGSNDRHELPARISCWRLIDDRSARWHREWCPCWGAAGPTRAAPAEAVWLFPRGASHRVVSLHLRKTVRRVVSDGMRGCLSDAVDGEWESVGLDDE